MSNPHPCWGINKARQKFIDAIIANSNWFNASYLAGQRPRLMRDTSQASGGGFNALKVTTRKSLIFVPHSSLSFNIKYCFSPSVLRETRNCDVDITNSAKLDKKFEPLIKELERTHPEVPIFDPNDLFCDARNVPWFMTVFRC